MPGTYISPAESGLYYLQSRYYNPKVGRFLNADALVSTGQGLLGNNMFAYCGNNPVNYNDSSGTYHRSAGASIRSVCIDTPGKRWNALAELQRQGPIFNINLDDIFPLHKNSEPCCGGVITAEVLAGNISTLAVTDEGLAFAGLDISLIRCAWRGEHHKIDIGNMLNANISWSNASVNAMLSAWTPSITVYTDRGTFTYSLYIGAIGFQARMVWDDSMNLALAPQGIGFGFSYER